MPRTDEASVKPARVPADAAWRSMTRVTNRKRPSNSISTSSNGSAVAYTAEQREQMRRGLRILARMVVRAHLRREASRTASSQPE